MLQHDIEEQKTSSGSDGEPTTETAHTMSWMVLALPRSPRKTVVEEKGALPVEFTPRDLVGYFTTQSNVEAAVKNGADYEAVTTSLLNQIEHFDLSGHFEYFY